MEGSFPLFSVRGIVIRMHITFPLILIWGAIQFGWLGGGGLSGAIFGVIVFLLLFAIVVLHELGHSFAAQYYGVPVKQIVLLPIGGVAQLSRIPEAPSQEFVIAIAGPAVNFALALVMLALGFVTGQGLGWISPAELVRNMGQLNFGAIANYVFISNLFLGIFNLIPAFPMDGGRVLRALLASQMSYVRATRIAVAVGQSLAMLFGLWGFLGGGFFMILIAIFIYLGAGQEGQLVEVRHVLSGLTVAQAYSHEARTLNPLATLRDAVGLTLSSFQADFPVIEDGRLVGLLTHTRLLEALNEHGPDAPVSEVMQTDIKPAELHEGMFAVQQRMMEGNLDALPVAQDGRFLGLITGRDISELYRLISNQPDLLPKARAKLQETYPRSS
jgi:stage IV sporulation protein FB